MLTVYLISIVVYLVVIGWGAKISVDAGETITVQECFWFTVMAFVPVVQQVIAIGSAMFIFAHYKDRPVFGGNKR